MNFEVRSLAETFSDLGYRARNKGYVLYSFILATTADYNIFPDLLMHFSELDELTSDNILIIMPKFLHSGASKEEIADYLRIRTIELIFGRGFLGRNIPDSARLEKTEDENNYFASRRLEQFMTYDKRRTKRSKRFVDCYIRSAQSAYNDLRRTDTLYDVEEFLKRQTSETIRFAKFCGLAFEDLPCILFFDSLDCPKSYLVWSLQEYHSADYLIKNFRKIMTELTKERESLSKNEKNALDVIQSLIFEMHNRKIIHYLNDTIPIVKKSMIPSSIYGAFEK